jgi:hypothetical protein
MPVFENTGAREINTLVYKAYACDMGSCRYVPNRSIFIARFDRTQELQ